MREYEFQRMDEHKKAEERLERRERELYEKLREVNYHRRVLELNEFEIKEVSND